MENNTDLMIDIETLGLGPTIVVTSIGIVPFFLSSRTVGTGLKYIMNIQDQLDKGRVVPASTLEFWSKQDQKIFQSQFSGTEDNLATLKKLSEFVAIYGGQNSKVWGNGATFDITILESLFSTYKIPVPWSYKSPMDLRTFKRFFASNKKIEGITHDCLEDAVAQAKFVCENYKEFEK